MYIGGYDFSFDLDLNIASYRNIIDGICNLWSFPAIETNGLLSYNDYLDSAQIFVYKNKEAKNIWDTVGLTNNNADDMFSMSIVPNGLSFVVGRKGNEAHCYIVKMMNELGFRENEDENEKPVIKSGDKLYLITRRDISPGYQAVQSCHAMRQFTADHPDADLEWFANSNTLALLSVDNEVELMRLVVKAKDLNLRWSVFREPDVGGAITAIAIESSLKTIELCKELPLALKEYNE